MRKNLVGGKQSGERCVENLLQEPPNCLGKRPGRLAVGHRYHREGPQPSDWRRVDAGAAIRLKLSWLQSQNGNSGLGTVATVFRRISVPFFLCIVICAALCNGRQQVEAAGGPAALILYPGATGIRFDPDLGPLEMVAATAMPAAVPTEHAPSGTSSWLEFHDPSIGLSFRYPPSLQVNGPQEFRTPAVWDPFGLDNPPSDLAKVVELVGDTPVNCGTVVLRFLVYSESTTPEVAAEKIKKAFEFQSRLHEDEIKTAPETGRPVCSSLSPTQLDGHEALLRIDCGRAAWHWTINILQPRPCRISTGLAGSDYAESVPPPHDGMFPLLSIIRTVHIDAHGMSSPAIHP